MKLTKWDFANIFLQCLLRFLYFSPFTSTFLYLSAVQMCAQSQVKSTYMEKILLQQQWR